MAANLFSHLREIAGAGDTIESLEEDDFSHLPQNMTRIIDSLVYLEHI